MDDTIGGFDVSNDDLHGVVQEHIAILDSDGDILAKYSGRAGKSNYIRSHDLARNDMIKKYVGQRLLPFGQEQCVKCASG